MIQYLYLGRVPYDESLRLQAEIAALRLAGRIPNTLLLLEHPPVLTLGRNAHRSNILASDELLAARGVTLYEINRGGDVTYHGPGQLVGYPIVDLRSLRGPSGNRLGPVDFVRSMEEVLIRLCAGFGVSAGRIKGLTGVWCGAETVVGSRSSSAGPEGPSGENLTPASASGEALKGHDFGRAVSQESAKALASDGSFSSEMRSPSPRLAFERQSRPAVPARKIAAIGIHVSRGITTHGFAFNLNPDLGDFDLIVPCGIRDRAVTSLAHEASPTVALPALESLANLAARNFGLVFSQSILAVGDLAALRAQAASSPQFPAQDTQLSVPSELERLRHAAERPVRA